VIFKTPEVTVIMNGGNPLPGCPESWTVARAWAVKANELGEMK
jgi:hypothetical protein